MTKPHGRTDLLVDLQRGETQCTARSKATGKRCRRSSSLGSNVCVVHGAAAPQTRAKAQRRLEQAADALVQRLLGMALDGDVADNVALAAIRDALDRAGMSPALAVELSAKAPQPWQQVLQGVARVSQADSRRARGLPVEDENPTPAITAADETTIVDAEVVDENPGTPSTYPTPAPTDTNPPPWPRPPYGPGADEPIIPPTDSPAAAYRPGKALVTIEQAEAAARQRQYAEAARRERERRRAR